MVKGIFVIRDRPFFFPWNVKRLIFSSWIVISIVAVKRDFEKIIFRETRNKCLIRREPWFSLCLCHFRQPLLRNKWYCVTVTGRLIPVATTWLVWLSVTFGQPSFSSSVSSVLTIKAQAHQRDVRDFFFASRRTRSGRIVKTTNKALLWT